MIAYGPLLSDGGSAWLGTAALLRAAGQDTARAVQAARVYDGIGVHPGSSVAGGDPSRRRPLSGALEPGGAADTGSPGLPPP
ncbi:hypothetical protein [Actinacidiphila sp. bgisy167]|uniref:hypothetical protein n=1 Tax=Actinacidiphila sp. bgisy167 TaxID=3413797 RepID=UPI003D71A1DA